MLSYPVYAINKENMGYTFRLQKLMGNLKSEHLLKIIKMSDRPEADIAHKIS